MRGWNARTATTVTASGAVAVVTGWLFGLPELSALGVAGVVAATASALWLHRNRVPPRIGLSVHPAVVHVGEPAALTVSVHNARRRRSPPLRIHGRLGTAGDGILAISPLPPGRTTEPVVSLPTAHRGLVHVEGLRSTVVDPLGWWALTTRVAARATLIVRPRVHPLGRDALGHGLHPATSGSRGRGHGGSAEDELVGLRPYVRGDDLRLIHWRTSARRLQPHVVQVEPPARSAAVVVLIDNRADGQRPDDFERSVEAAASVVVHFAGRGHPVRLLTGDGWDSGPVDPDRHGDLLDALAAVDRRQGTRLHEIVPRLAGADTAAVVLCTACTLPLTVGLGRDEERLVVIACTSTSLSTPGTVVRWPAGSLLGACWDERRAVPPGEATAGRPFAPGPAGGGT